jgi:alpha-glucosidase (family GH31 glycosyl hydrolase)
MVLEYQDDPNTYDKDLQYFFGREFLVAPIYDETSKRSIYLPKGKWIDYWNLEEYEGPTNIIYKAALDKIPLFIRADSIIPMGPEMSYVGEKKIEPIILDIYVYTTAEFTIYDEKTTTNVKCIQDDNGLLLEISDRKITYIAKFNKTACPKEIKKNDRLMMRLENNKGFSRAKEGWMYNNSGKVLVKIAKGKKVSVRLFLKSEKRKV